MSDDVKHIQELLGALPPITLEEMSSVRLMNRTDTKFVTTIPQLIKLLALVRDDYRVQEACGHRLSPYATTYWDVAHDHTMFRTHVLGRKPRTKVRVRTYVDSHTSFLEVKHKDNHGKTDKKRVSAPSADCIMTDAGDREFVAQTAGYAPESLCPTLSNRFDRITLVNNAETERITIDINLCFRNCETQREAELDNLVIIELKRDGRQPSNILPLLRQLRIKPSGFSKYCIGSAITNGALPQNRFKPRLRRLSKLNGAPLASSFPLETPKKFQR